MSILSNEITGILIHQGLQLIPRQENNIDRGQMILWDATDLFIPEPYAEQNDLRTYTLNGLEAHTEDAGSRKLYHFTCRSVCDWEDG